jgi:hypothetical protein
MRSKSTAKVAVRSVILWPLALSQISSARRP